MIKRASGDGRSLSHVDAAGRARMVDVSSKSRSSRTARASALVSMSQKVLAMLRAGSLAKGDPLSVAEIAGVMAAKRTWELIPLCHQIAVGSVKVDAQIDEKGVLITAEVSATDKTGVEMEAMTAAAVAALCVYDMCKAADKSITIEKVQLLSKSGGKSGPFSRGD